MTSGMARCFQYFHQQTADAKANANHMLVQLLHLLDLYQGKVCSLFEHF